MSTIDITGNLGADARLNTGDFGLVAGFSLGYTPRKKERGTDNWVDAGPTLWFDVSAWGDLADKYGDALVKGARVRVIGTLGSREHDGRTYTTVRADMLTVIPSKNSGTGSTGGGFLGAASKAADPWANVPNATVEPPF